VKRVVLRRAAQAELREARDWYESRHTGLGVEFVGCVDAAITDIGEHPERHPTVHGDVRRRLVRRFPYGVFYLVASDRVVVLAVFHSSRDPILWQSR
jgi:toxin ParE1/3/4